VTEPGAWSGSGPSRGTRSWAPLLQLVESIKPPRTIVCLSDLRIRGTRQPVRIGSIGLRGSRRPGVIGLFRPAIGRGHPASRENPDQWDSILRSGIGKQTQTQNTLRGFTVSPLRVTARTRGDLATTQHLDWFHHSCLTQVRQRQCDRSPAGGRRRGSVLPGRLQRAAWGAPQAKKTEVPACSPAGWRASV
jgi:hypothetical protein